MDQQKIIHLVGECVVVGGIFIYLQRQINSLKKEISELKEVSMKQQDYIEKNFIGIEKTLDYLMNKSTNQYENIKPNYAQNTEKQGLINRKNKINVTNLSEDCNSHTDSCCVPLTTYQQHEENEIVKKSNKNVHMLNKTPTLSVLLVEKESFSSMDDSDDIKEELEELEELDLNDKIESNNDEVIVNTLLEQKPSLTKLIPEKKVKKTKPVK